MVKYTLSYVSKGNECHNGICLLRSKKFKLDLKASVRHMSNVFLNGVETSHGEATCVVLQLPTTEMNRQTLFLHTAHLDERTFLLKDYETLPQMNPDSHNIHSDSILIEYQRRPKYLENCCLAEFASLPRIVYPVNITLEDPYDSNIDDNTLEPENVDIKDKVFMVLSNSLIIRKKNIAKDTYI